LGLLTIRVSRKRRLVSWNCLLTYFNVWYVSKDKNPVVYWLIVFVLIITFLAVAFILLKETLTLLNPG